MAIIHSTIHPTTHFSQTKNEMCNRAVKSNPASFPPNFALYFFQWNVGRSEMCPLWTAGPPQTQFYYAVGNNAHKIVELPCSSEPQIA